MDKKQSNTQTETREKIAVWMDKAMLAELKKLNAKMPDGRLVPIPYSDSVRAAVRMYLDHLKNGKKKT